MNEQIDVVYREALARFDDVYTRAKATDLRDPTAVTLATADRSGQPYARTVLLKGYDERGFVIYTNNQSRKGAQLRENPKAALLFFWQTLFEQASIAGPVEVVSDEESDAYWFTRSRESRVGAWASAQSQVLDARDTLEAEVTKFEAKFRGVDVPRPPHWHGFRVCPERIEFWQSGDHRLHDRQCYTQTDDGWTMTLLNP
ncbi:MAG: pyridoxamine 5'-phosphate oxidase [Gammaproteobacteria bacterium]|nr:pyridoxamine 5'-phosphate oxidase [Gammaproteobacteria bacterium]